MTASDFTLWPAIDLRRGRVVRLAQGRDEATMVYGDDPASVAADFAAAGAYALHVVDLDAAFGDGNNRAQIAAIAKVSAMRIEVGGGVRDDEAVRELLDLGVDRVIVGSAAVENPAWVERLIVQHGPRRVIVGIDARDGEVKTRGWVEGSRLSALDVARQMRLLGVEEVVHTDIARDGMLSGANIGASLELASLGLRVVVSGGIASLDDLAAAFAARDRGIAGVVTGKALYERRFALADALEVCRAQA